MPLCHRRAPTTAGSSGGRGEPGEGDGFVGPVAQGLGVPAPPKG